MSNRLTKGTAVAGFFASEKPGMRFGAAVNIAATGSTAEKVTDYVFPELAVIHDMYVKVTSVSATSGTLHVGLSSAASSSVYDGFISGLPVGTSGIFTASPGTTTYYGVLLASTGTVNKKVFAIGSCSTGAGAAGTATMRYLTYTSTTTSTIYGTITPLFYELK